MWCHYFQYPLSLISHKIGYHEALDLYASEKYFLWLFMEIVSQFNFLALGEKSYNLFNFEESRSAGIIFV